MGSPTLRAIGPSIRHPGSGIRRLPWLRFLLSSGTAQNGPSPLAPRRKLEAVRFSRPLQLRNSPYTPNMMTQQCEIAIIVKSSQLTLSQLTGLLGREPESGSHDTGSPRLGDSGWDTTVWRESARDQNGSLEAQCLQVLKDVAPACEHVRRANPNDVMISLDIAAFFKAAYATVELPTSVIDQLAGKRISVNITCYPCGDE
jgi:hypothetical protein